jgi:HK97 family phage portal protein
MTSLILKGIKAMLDSNEPTSYQPPAQATEKKSGMEEVEIGQLSPTALRSFLLGGGVAEDYYGTSNLTFPIVASQAFEQNSVTYKCVMMIANGVAALKYKLLNTQSGKQIDSHPLLDLLARPNPLESRYTFLSHVVADILLDGNAFIEMVKINNQKAPGRLWTQRPDMVQIQVGQSRLPFSYTYSAGGVEVGQSKIYPVDPVTGQCDVLHLSSYAPLRENSNGRGLSPVRAAWLSVLTHNEGARFNLNLIKNGAKPSGVLTSEENLSTEQVADLKGTLAQNHQGSRNAAKPMLLGGGLTWQSISLSPTDLGYLEGKDSVARDIATVLGVPPNLLNLPGDNTYNNVAEAKLALYEETIIPRARQIVEDFNRWLVPLFGPNLSLEIDEDAIPALEPKRAEKWAAIMASTIHTINEKRALLGFEPVDNGDEILVPSNMLPLAETVIDDNEELKDDEDEEDEDTDDGDDE